MSSFVLTRLPLAGLYSLEHRSHRDSRGFLERFFCMEELAAAGWHKPIAQINRSHTAKRGTVRGMHFQYPPSAEMKLVRCLRGEIWDVSIDLRTDSPTFLQWHAEHLSADKPIALLIPEGFAHGFQTLSDDVEILYCHSAAYDPGSEGGINPLDDRLGIRWILPISEISDKDSERPFIKADFKGVEL